MFSKSLRMVKIDRNMLEFNKLCKKHNFGTGAIGGFVVRVISLYVRSLVRKMNLKKVTTIFE